MPILGDTKYESINPVTSEAVVNECGCGLHLCAIRIAFDHPILQQVRVDVSIDVPKKFSERLRREQSRYVLHTAIPSKRAPET